MGLRSIRLMINPISKPWPSLIQAPTIWKVDKVSVVHRRRRVVNAFRSKEIRDRFAFLVSKHQFRAKEVHFEYLNHFHPIQPCTDVCTALQQSIQPK